MEVIKHLLFPIFYSMEEKNGSQKGISNCLFTNIFQNIFLCVQQKKEIHTGLESE